MILQKENPILRNTARVIEMQEIGGKYLTQVIENMQTELLSQEDGVAIAAPQIGESIRMFIISRKVFNMTKKYAHLQGNDIICINPVITKLSKEKKEMEEGCLSVRYLYGKVKRAYKASIEYTNEKGEKKTMSSSGLLAQIFQHEIDHLNGILFIDTAKNIEEVLPQKK